MSRLHSAQLIVVVLAILGLLSDALAQSSTDRGRLLDEIELLRNEISNKEQQLLSPAPEDAAKFQSFLAEPDTGLIRLIPREVYDRRLIISGGGAYYSFTELTHEYGRGPDISLERNRFSVGFAGLDWGSRLCQIRQLNRLVWKPMPSGSPPSSETPQAEAEVRSWQRLSGQGFSRNGVGYKRAVTLLITKMRSQRLTSNGELVNTAAVPLLIDGNLQFE